MKTIDEIKTALESRKDRSAWNKGVTCYAIDLLDNLAGVDLGSVSDSHELESILLNGARDWDQYSWGGCALAYDYDIAGLLCTPSELKKTRHGERRPNSREEWLDVQARALYQACNRIKKCYNRAYIMSRPGGYK